MKISPRSVLLAASVLLVTSVPAASQALAAPAPGPGTVVLELMPGLSGPQLTRVLERSGLVLSETVEGSAFVVVRNPRAVPLETLSGLPGVVGAEAPVVHGVLYTPNDPLYRHQWNLRSVQAPRAWDAATGSNVVVAVVDTGVAYRTAGPFRAVPDISSSRFVQGADFVEDDSTPDDEHGHGTHVAGTIAQSTGNGYGAAGLAFNAKIMPVRVLDADGSGFDFDVAQGIRYAARNGARVINLSVGGPLSSRVLADSVRYAASRGAVVVAAAGNDSLPKASYPAAYREVIAVGATRFDNQLAYYSNFGPEVDIVAPGGDVLVDQDRDGKRDGVVQQTLNGGPGRFCFCAYQGTSMATPHVAAAAALLVERGTSSPAGVRTALLGTAKDLGLRGRDPVYGAGLLQARSALDRAYVQRLK